MPPVTNTYRVNKNKKNKGVNFELMAESQFLLNYIGYLKKIAKSASHFSRIFFNNSQSTGQNSVKISVVSIFKLFHRLALNSVEKTQR